MRGNALVSLFVAGSVLAWPKPSASQEPAARPTSLGLELTITSGKLSQPPDKRDVRVLRAEVAVGGAAVRIEDRIAEPVTVSSTAGDQTRFVPIGLALDVSARQPRNDELLVDLTVTDQVPVPTPISGIGATGAHARHAVQGVTLSTTLQAQPGAVVEVAALEDPVADRAWRLVAQVRSEHLPPTATVMNGFVARIEESMNHRPTTTYARLTVAPGAKGRLVDEVSVPVAVTAAGGPRAELVPLTSGLSVTPVGRGSFAVEIGAARLRPPGPGRDASWVQRNASRAVPLLPGAAPVEIGAISDANGTALFRATIALAKQD